MKIILEGPDSSGKTTLAKALSAEFNLPIIKWGRKPRNAVEVFDRLSFLHMHGGCIYDRLSLISEIVYQKATNRVQIIDSESSLRLIRKMDAIFIYCRPSKSMVMETEDPDFENVHGQNQRELKFRLVDEYDKLFSDILEDIYFIQFDWTEQSFEEIYNECRRCKRC